MPKQPERITPADLVAQIAADLVWDGDVDDVIELAVQEMGQRMADPLRRADVPDHVLIKFVAEANKTAERRQAQREREQTEVATQDELAVITDSRLPWDKKEALLTAALERLDVRRAQIVKLLQGETDV